GQQASVTRVRAPRAVHGRPRADGQRGQVAAAGRRLDRRGVRHRQERRGVRRGHGHPAVQGRQLQQPRAEASPEAPAEAPRDRRAGARREPPRADDRAPEALLQGRLGEARHRRRPRQEAARQAPRRRHARRQARDRARPEGLLRRMRGLLRGARLLLLLAAPALGAALAQPALVVNGREVPGNTTALVSGTSYAPAATLASALGASAAMDLGGGVVVLVAGGRIMQVLVAPSPAEAASLPGAIRRDGAVVPGPGAVVSVGEVYLPVKPVAEALGASVTFLEGQNTVMVVQPRARLTAVRRLTDPERLELHVSAPVRYSTYYNEPVQTLQVHFERTGREVRVPPVEG